MAIDFEIPAEAKAIRERVRQWVHDECMPAEKRLLAGEDYKTVLGELRKKARAQGLWCPFIPKEYGGMGLGPLANALVQMELGESYLGALSMNTQGPDDATMLTLLEHGTRVPEGEVPEAAAERRQAHLLLDDREGRRRRCDRHADARRSKNGNDNYVLNGEKWFSSAASVADIAVVMAKTDPNAPRHQQFSTFIVELPNPGYKIKRDIQTMAIEGPLSHILGGGHSEIEIKDLEVPAENLLGGEGNGFNMGQHRLAYGRLRHGMHNVAMAQRALDMATAHVTKRSTFGKKLDERQAVQFMLAECASELYIARLMLLHIAYKAENKHGPAPGERHRQGVPRQHGAQGGRHRDPAARRARLFAAIRRWRPGTRTSARSGWSTARTKCTSGRPAATSSRRSRRPARRPAPAAATCCDRVLQIALQYPTWRRHRSDADATTDCPDAHHPNRPRAHAASRRSARRCRRTRRRPESKAARRFPLGRRDAAFFAQRRERQH